MRGLTGWLQLKAGRDVPGGTFLTILIFFYPVWGANSSDIPDDLFACRLHSHKQPTPLKFNILKVPFNVSYTELWGLAYIDVICL